MISRAESLLGECALSPRREATRSDHRTAARAFSLIELVVASAIAVIVTTASISSVLSVSRTLAQTREVAIVDDQAKHLIDFFVSSTQGAGGKGIRPWASVQAVNSTTDSDTLIIIRSKPEVDECAIVGRPGAGSVLELAKDAATHTVCCNTAAFENKKLTIITPDGNEWGVAVSNNSNTSNCRVTFPPGGGGMAVDDSLSRMPGNQDNFVGGLVVAATVERWYRDSDNRLIRELDTNDDGVIAASERIVAAEEVFDFQVAQGYDADGDGIIFDDNSNDDEWFGNAVGDTKDSGRLEDVPVDTLRMLQIGIIVGGVDNDAVGTSTRRLLDGPSRSATKTVLRPTIGRAFLRNLLTFL